MNTILDFRSDDIPHRLLTAGEVAEVLNLRLSWVRDKTRQGELPHVKLGHYVRYRPADVQEYVEAQRAGRKPAKA